MNQPQSDLRPVEMRKEVSLSFTASAHGARLSHRMLTTAGPVLAGSNFSKLADYGPPITVHELAYSYLIAAAEHLLFWADTMAPLLFHPDQRNEITLRPTNTLARAGMEASAQAIWLLDSTHPRELMRRHVAMLRMELGKRLQSEVVIEARKVAADEERTFVETAKAAGLTDADLKAPAGYLAFIKATADVNGMAYSAEDLEQTWRYASGVAHGHHWVKDVMTELVPAPEGSGAAKLIRVPDQARLARVIETSVSMLQLGVLRYLDFLGVDIGERVEAARIWLARVAPLIDESRREELIRSPPFMDATSDDRSERGVMKQDAPVSGARAMFSGLAEPAAGTVDLS